VDPHLGGNDALAKLSDELHSKGMRLVLDAVLNHTSVHHIWFDKFEGERTQHTHATKCPTA
jgi:alpha-glucosidase